MKNKIKYSVFALLSLMSISTNILLANASAGNNSSSSSSIITPNLPPIYSPVDPNAPSMGNLSVSQSTFDVGSTTPLTLKYDYKNIPGADPLPQMIIYKDGDASKTDLKKNYLNYNSSALSNVLAQPNSGPQTGTVEYRWYGQANELKYLDAGTYVFEVSWSDSSTQLATQSIKFNLTNTSNYQPLYIANVVITPSPFNPTTGDLVTANFNIIGLHSGETVGTLNYLVLDTSQILFNGSKLNLSNGSNSVNWNGKDSASHAVANGTYKFYLKAITSENRSINVGPMPLLIDSTVTNPAQTTADTSTTTTTTTPTSTTTSTDTNCAGFTDVKSTDANCAIYTWTKSAGIFTGNADGTFNPNGLLQRDQVIKTVLEAFKKYHSGTEYCTNGEAFPDVAKDSWAREYVCLAKTTYVRGAYLVTGYQSGPYKGLFLPANNVNRSEFLAMILRSLPENMPTVTVKPYSDVELNQWDTGFAAYAALHLKTIYPQPKLDRAKAVTRMEAARVFYALHNLGAF